MTRVAVTSICCNSYSFMESGVMESVSTGSSACTGIAHQTAAAVSGSKKILFITLIELKEQKRGMSYRL